MRLGDDALVREVLQCGYELAACFAVQRRRPHDQRLCPLLPVYDLSLPPIGHLANPTALL